jgi:hypothetical protein
METSGGMKSSDMFLDKGVLKSKKMSRAAKMRNIGGGFIQSTMVTPPAPKYTLPRSQRVVGPGNKRTTKFKPKRTVPIPPRESGESFAQQQERIRRQALLSQRLVSEPTEEFSEGIFPPADPVEERRQQRKLLGGAIGSVNRMSGMGMSGTGIRSFLGKVGKLAKSIGFELNPSEVAKLAEKASEELIASGSTPGLVAGTALKVLTPIVTDFANKIVAQRQQAGARRALAILKSGTAGMTPESFLAGGRFPSKKKLRGRGVFVS